MTGYSGHCSKSGNKLMFHGAADTQKILPYGTIEDVIKHSRELIRILGRNGGYVFCPGNDIQSDTPVENIKAMYDEALKTA